MKLLLVVLACAVAVNAIPARNDCDGSSTVSEDVSEIFSGTVDIDSITLLFWDVLENPDPEVEAVLYFIYGPEFRALLNAVMSEQFVIDAYNYLTQEAGFNTDRFWEILDQYFGIQKPSVRVASMRNGSTLEYLVAQIRAAVDWETISRRGHEKAQSSCAFGEFIAHLRSDETQAVFRQLQNNETYQHIVQALHELGLDVDFIRDIIGPILEWN